MKISSKSILSPGRAGVRDPLNTLSTSLSRRLRNSGSVKGAASPAMFPTTTAAAKKRGTFENPEPSSPKVTCIGQVRVRSKKKQAKKLRTLSRRHTGEVSFRNLEHSINGFPSKRHKHKESSNLGSNETQRKWVHFPVTVCDALRAFGSEFSCLFPCRTERGKEEKTVAEDGNRQGYCGVFARWLVAVQDGDDGGKRDIELVVGDEEPDQEDDDDDEEESFWKSRRHVFEDLQIINDRIEGHKDEARVSICVPPKNALLLMRCRSDTIKIQALTNQSWEPNIAKTDEQDELVDQDLEVEQKQVMILDQHQENVQQQDEVGQDQEHDNVQQKDEVGQDQEHDNVQTEEESFNLVSLFEETLNKEYEFAEISEELEPNNGVLERENENVLPECLLMMMYEPKLSMEVSKETWVCRKDFIRRQSSRRKPPAPPPPPAVIKPDGGDESSVSVNDVMRVADGGFATVLRQPARSSCSFPAAPSMAMMLEQKLANAVGYEPFVLTRCKSEPMKTAASKLLQESCVLENRKLDLERLSQGRFGVGAAGLGF